MFIDQGERHAEVDPLIREFARFISQFVSENRVQDGTVSRDIFLGMDLKPDALIADRGHDHGERAADNRRCLMDFWIPDIG